MINVAEKVDAISTPKNEEIKVLGVNWDQCGDKLTFDLNVIYQNSLDLQPTKRNILKLMASIYDPIGILAVLVMKVKILFQRICLSKSKWDEILSSDLLSKWFLLREIFKITLSVPRYYFSTYSLNEVKNVYINGFCDASKNGYAAVIYINGHAPNNKNVGNIVMCKTKVAPVKPMSIPRLELLSCLLLSQLLNKVLLCLQTIINIHRFTCWSDSLDSIHWIKGLNKSWPKFVQSRVEKIRDIVPPEHWRHIPGKINPADLPSRGSINEDEIKAFLSVPAFLHDENDWPPDRSLSDAKMNDVNRIVERSKSEIYVLQTDVRCIDE